jgi:hypothetical protein
MNERFAVDPEAFRSSAELRFVLAHFGPKAGRYLATLPSAWFEQVREVAKTWPSVEASRASVLLQRAAEQRQVLRERYGSSWNSGRRWLDNVRPALTCKPIRITMAVVGDDEELPEDLPQAVHLGDLHLAPTSDERIDATIEEYRRVCSVLLSISHEIFVVDPYFDPSRHDHADVLAALWRDACEGPCRLIAIWSLSREVMNGRRPKSADAVKRALLACKPRGPKRVPALEMRLVDDAVCEEKMHARYLLSIHGGVRLERGFQRYSKAKVDISPVSDDKLLEDLLGIYKDERNDFRVDCTIRA